MDLPHRLFTGDVQRLYRDLLAAQAGGAIDFGAATALVVGGSNVDGVSALASRADHKHALPAFGTTAGTFAEGNDARFGAAGTVWDARVVPSSGLHADSDEFLTDTIADWAEWDPGTFQTSAVEFADGEQHMRFTATGNGSVRFGGRYKAVPSSEFLFVCYVANDGFTDNNAPFCGLLLGEDLAGAAATSDFLSNDFCTRRNTDANHGSVNSRVSTIYSSAGTASTRLLDGPTGVWLAAGVRMNAAPTTEMDCYWSTDGRYWTFIATGVSAYQAQHYGIVYEQQAANPSSMVVKHFRVFDGTSDPADIINGGYL